MGKTGHSDLRKYFIVNISLKKRNLVKNANELSVTQQYRKMITGSKTNEPTCQDSTSDPRDALDLSHIVANKVFVTGSVEKRWITEHLPQLGCDCPISCLNGLGTNIKGLPHQSAIPQNTHPRGIEKHTILKYCCCSDFCACVFDVNNLFGLFSSLN